MNAEHERGSELASYPETLAFGLTQPRRGSNDSITATIDYGVEPQRGSPYEIAFGALGRASAEEGRASAEEGSAVAPACNSGSSGTSITRLIM